MDIKILVCYHSNASIIASKILTPIFVGAKIAKKEMLEAFFKSCAQKGIKALRDDYIQDSNDREEGISKAQNPLLEYPAEISALNPYFCELTGIYWAYKNLKADYYGLFHYRRLFCFSRFEQIKHKILGFFSTSTIYYDKNWDKNLEANLKKFKLDDKSLEAIIPQFDIIKLKPWIKDNAKSYKDLDLFSDLQKCADLITQKYPQMKKHLDKVLFQGKYPTSMANMFVMKRQYFESYCKWLFDILFHLYPQIPFQTHNTYQKRVMGMLSEWMFNVWLEYEKEQNPQLKIADCPLLFINKPRHKPLFGFSIENNQIKRFYFLKIRLFKSCIR